MREGQRRDEQVAAWTRDGVWPYPAPPQTATDIREREVFADVSVSLARHLKGGKDTKRVQLRLLREALVRQPAELYPVLDELFRLRPAEREHLASLLERAPLARLVQANRLAVDRIDFLGALRRLVLDPVPKNRLRERDELHVMLEHETWVFGEEYTALLSERGLTQVLHRHLELLRGTPQPRPEPVRADNGGQVGRVDLLLSKEGGWSGGRRRLVVELKRPSAVLTDTELGQLRRYAGAVRGDSRFAHEQAVMWDFWLVGTDMDQSVRDQARQDHLPPGCVQQGGGTRLWVRTWGEIIEQCEDRLRHYQQVLEYQSEPDHELDYLARTFPELIRTRSMLALPPGASA